MLLRERARRACAQTGDSEDVGLLLEGKRAFVTGGTRGIGAAICELFAREGADVAFNFNSREDLAEQTKQKIEGHGRRAHSYKISVTDRLGLKRMTRERMRTTTANTVMAASQ